MTTQNQGFPQINTPLVDPKGRVTPSWFKLFIALWNRTGAGQGESGPYVPTNVFITGGSINGTVIGNDDPSSGTFTVLRATSALLATNFTGSSSGINTGNVTLTGETYLTIAGQLITANPINLANTNVTGILATTHFNTLLATAAASSTSPVANGTYTVGARLTGGGTDGTITTIGGVITAITQAT